MTSRSGLLPPAVPQEEPVRLLPRPRDWRLLPHWGGRHLRKGREGWHSREL